MLISYWSSDVCSSDLLDGHSRRRSQSLVSYGHELSRHHRVARDVRLHRQVGRRLVALRRSGKIAHADGLAPTRLRSRLEPPAAPDEWQQLLYAHTDQWRYETLKISEILSIERA